MGSIRTLSTGRYQVRWREPDGTEPSRTFTKKRDADAFLTEIEAQILHGDYVSPTRGKVKFEEVAETWRASPDWSETTRERNDGMLRNYVLPRWGKVRLDQINHDDAQRWVNRLCVDPRVGPGTAPLEAGSIRKVVGAFGEVLRLAVKSRNLRVDVSDGLRLPRIADKKRRYLSATEVERLAEAAGDEKALIYVLAYTGLRFGEMAALRAENVDLKQRRLKIEASVTDVNGHLAWTLPKGHKRRSVPMPEFVADLLAIRIAGLAADDLVFTTASGSPLRNNNFRRDWFDQAVIAAGVGPLTPHELRHTTASLAISAGASVLSIQRMLGHKKPSTTLDVYADLFEGDLDEVAVALSALRKKTLVDGSWMEQGDQSSD
jgi:integrase